MADKIPNNLIESQPRRLSELHIGETAHLWTFNMHLTDAGECYLDAEAELTERSVGTIQVARRENGYHVTVVAKGTKWRPHALTTEKPFRLPAFAKSTTSNWVAM